MFAQLMWVGFFPLKPWNMFLLFPILLNLFGNTILLSFGVFSSCERETHFPLDSKMALRIILSCLHAQRFLFCNFFSLSHHSSLAYWPYFSEMMSKCLCICTNSALFERRDVKSKTAIIPGGECHAWIGSGTSKFLEGKVSSKGLQRNEKEGTKSSRPDTTLSC